MPGFAQYKAQLARLGPHWHSSLSRYITRLARVEMDVLESMIANSVQQMKHRYSWKM
jgi:hypothetical protein